LGFFLTLSNMTAVEIVYWIIFGGFILCSVLIQPNFMHVDYAVRTSKTSHAKFVDWVGTKYEVVKPVNPKLEYEIKNNNRTTLDSIQVVEFRPKLASSAPHALIPETILGNSEVKIELRASGVTVSQKNKGLDLLKCFGPFEVPTTSLGHTIVRIVPKINVLAVHHVIAFGVDEWNPAKHKTGCGNGLDSIFYAWSRNGMEEDSFLPILSFPDKTGFQTLSPNNFKLLFLQVHYYMTTGIEFEAFDTFADTSGIDVVLKSIENPHPLVVSTLFSNRWSLPPQQRKYDVCQELLITGSGWDSIGKKVYGSRGHAQEAGREIFTTVHRDGAYIGTLSPVFPFQPQTFYLSEQNVLLKPGDSLALHCIYNTEERSEVTNVGHDGEMCNQYLITDALGKSTLRNLPGKYIGPIEGKRDSKQHGACAPTFPRLELQDSVPVPEAIGEITGIVTNSDGELFAFHRAGRAFNSPALSVIKESTLIKWSRDFKIIKEFGSNLFYMPHGLACDCAGDLWTTDLVSKRVLQLSGVTGEVKRELKGSFKQPSNIAFDSHCSKIFIADGRSGIAVYDYITSNFLFEVGISGKIHDLAIDDNDLIYVADKDNFRILVFSEDGHFVAQWSDMEPTPGLSSDVLWYKDVAAVTFDPNLSIFWTIQSGSLIGRTKVGLEVTRVDGPFNWPHDVEVSPAGDILVAEFKGSTIKRYALSESQKDSVPIPLHYSESTHVDKR